MCCANQRRILVESALNQRRISLESTPNQRQINGVDEPSHPELRCRRQRVSLRPGFGPDNGVTRGHGIERYQPR